MAVVPFYRVVGDRAIRETRSVQVTAGWGLPADSYGFIECYCTDPKCDCRRVIFHVWSEGAPGKVWAMITYGWETAEYYEKWSSWARGEDAEKMASARLDPMGPRTERADALLELFKDVLLMDADYVARLKRHYREACPERVSKGEAEVRKMGRGSKRKRRRR